MKESSWRRRRRFLVVLSALSLVVGIGLPTHDLSAAFANPDDSVSATSTPTPDADPSPSPTLVESPEDAESTPPAGSPEPADPTGTTDPSKPAEPAELPEPAAGPSSDSSEPAKATEAPTKPSSPAKPPAASQKEELLGAEADELPGGMVMPMALNQQNCNYANPGTGAYASNLCWFNLTGFTTKYRDRGILASPRYVSVLDPTNGPFTHTVPGSQRDVTEWWQTADYWGRVQNVDVDMQLGGGYRLTAKIDTNSSGTNAARALVSDSFPTYSGAFLGNTIGGVPFYTGVAGQPALYQAVDAGGGTSQITLKNIRLYDGAGVEIRQFSIVVADAESTDQNEAINWTTTGQGFRWLPNTPLPDPPTSKNQVMGNACPQAATPAWNSTTPSASASCTANVNAPKTGTPMLATAPPSNSATSFNVTQSMKGSGRQAIAFGVMIARAELEIKVDDRVLNNSGGITNADFSGVMDTVTDAHTTQTGTSALSATTGLQGVPVLSTGTAITYTSTVTGTAASSYTPSWVCTKSPNGTNERWPGPTGSSPTPPTAADPFILLHGNQTLKCTVTYTPPYLSLKKEVDNGSTGATNTPAHFTLTAEGAATPQSKISGAGNSAPAVTKRPVAIGDYSLTETEPSGAGAWQYGYDWTDLECVAQSGSTSFNPVIKTLDPVTNAVTKGTLTVAAGNDLLCTYSNTAREPHLTLIKEAFDAAGNPLNYGKHVGAGDVVTYRLTFDNTDGTADMAVDHTDHLADVLDDATYNAGSIRYGNGSAPPAATSPLSPGVTATPSNMGSANPTIALTGTVPRGQIRTVAFSVTVKANTTDAIIRQDEVSPLHGYSLHNYLTEAGDPAPASCEEPDAGDDPTCTKNPISAWTLRKDSQPEDGAMIHSGGNNYFRVKVTNFSGEDLTDVKIIDDLTETLSAGTWDPTAPPAVPVHYGISYWDASNNLLDSDVWNPATGPAPVWTCTTGPGTCDFDPLFPDANPFPGGQWIFETPSFTVPAKISGTPVAYAIVGYAIKGGQVADPVNPKVAYVDSGSPVAALPNAIWVNTAQANAAKINGVDTLPNRCAAPVPPGWDQDGPSADYGDCKTYHSLGESYFHLWKKTTDTSLGENNNQLGATFVLADTYADAEVGNPSRWLCRTNNNPNSANYVPPGSDPSISGTVDFGGGSATWQAIADWNRDPLNINDQRDQCGLFYYLTADSEGQAAGSWRAMDIRGGDTTGTDPLPDWRNQSAFNNGTDDSEGRHGTYWLVETVSPDNHQLLAKPMKLWVAPSSPTPPSLSPGQLAWYDYQGRLSMPVVGVNEPAPAPGQGMAGTDEIRTMCVNPWVLPAHNQPACVMPTGWTMPIFDVKLQPLPLTGAEGNQTSALLASGAAVLVMALGGTLWWHRRRNTPLPKHSGGAV